MYLKEIIVSGFKSFADKLEIKLDNSTTCIVGPNGSGKSNVVDAVRWVLGEQSVKELRGASSMTDVIFSGSKSRNPLNAASVELVFDNTDKFINTPYSTISIKRRVYRTGENEYFLNNERCRLKDITTLLMDSGMSKASFNIISQGEVEKVFSSTPEERRIIFEEAAGVLKYKKRKEEALRKLDKTNSNLSRANDIINELELQLSPLKKQREKAIEYTENKTLLENLEVSLLAHDIEKFNNELNKYKTEKDKLTSNIEIINNKINKNEVDTLSLSNEIDKKELNIKELNSKLLKITEEVSNVLSEKELLKERSKNTNNSEISEKTRKILEEKSKSERVITTLKKDLEIIIDKSNSLEEEGKEIEDKILSLKKEKAYLQNEYSKTEKFIIGTEHRINNLKEEIDSSSSMPHSVKSILSNNKLEGIYDVIGNVVDTNEEYIKALNTAITPSKNFIITEDEEKAKEAIKYLKNNNLGRATLFPLSVIKGRYIDQETLNNIKDSKDFIGVLSDLLEYDEKYKNIITNQFGNILLSPTLDSATKLSHKIKSKYRIITLEGDTVNVGGSLNGGSNQVSKSTPLLKQELQTLKNKLEELVNDKEILLVNTEKNNENIRLEEEKIFTNSKEKVSLRKTYEEKNIQIEEETNKLKVLTTEWEQISLIKDGGIDKKEEELIKLYNDLKAEKEILLSTIKSVSKEVDLAKQKLEEQLGRVKMDKEELRKLENLSNNYCLEINKLDIKVDNMLNTLSTEYELTYERAKSKYFLEIDPELARAKVNTYRTNLKRIGMVNLDAIEEYDKVNTRYEFLVSQRDDLYKAQTTLLDIMNEMDEVMEEEFKNTFAKVKEEFKKVFKELFGGGEASLKLTDEENILKTGVDIIASPPGKKLSTISLLSGGEKALTAISLLFAILNVRRVPFCLFDEVEAALDEANVQRFGKYLNNYKDATQFLIITHKKKTMEYANTLYGITMQESGVSKLVSVKLDIDKEAI